MQRVTIHEAKTHLSRLVLAVERGEEVIISRATQPVARLVAYGTVEEAGPPGKRVCFGVDPSGWRVPDDFNEPLPDDIVDSFS